MRRAVFLDRDGVINRTEVRGGAPRPPRSAAELELLPGVEQALAFLAEQGLLLVVVTNQPDVARGVLREADVEAIHERLRDSLPLDAVLACYHDESDGCACRKPRPGLLEKAAQEHGIDLGQSFLVGDQWRDIEAGRAAGCVTLLLSRPYSQRERCAPDYEAADLPAAAAAIAERLREDRR